MSADNPVIKFSPFEALLIGEKNKIVKRKPMKNTIFVTCLTHPKKHFDLRELFDIKKDIATKKCENSMKKRSGRASEFLRSEKKLRVVKNKNKIKEKSKLNPGIYRYEFEDHNIIVKDNHVVKGRKRIKKIQSNKVRFKRDFKYKETLEERIVHKIQKRKKKYKTNLVGNGILSQLRKPHPNRHCLRGKNGKFIRKEEYEKTKNDNVNKSESKIKSLSNYLKHLYMKKSTDILKAKDDKDYYKSSILEVKGLPKTESETVLNNISIQYYQNLVCKQFSFPPLTPHLEVIDFDDDTSLMDIIYECQSTAVEFTGNKEFHDLNESLENAEIAQRRKGLKMYERKKSAEKNTCSIREFFNNSMKENHCINKSSNLNNLNNSNECNIISKGRRYGMKYLIDERPTKDNQLISKNKFRSLFYKTACGSETYLGNITKPVLLNSTFGRLPDIS